MPQRGNPAGPTLDCGKFFTYRQTITLEVSIRGGFVSGLLLVVMGTLVEPAAGQDAGTPRVSMPSGSAPLSAPVVSRAAQVRALIAGLLDVSVAPQTLFDVALEDEVALRIEAARVRALLRAIDPSSRPPDVAVSPTKRSTGEPTDAGSVLDGLGAVDPARWSQRLELDRARLDFYELSSEERAHLLHTHALRQEAARPRESEEARLAREAAAEREKALAAAKAARSEAERLVSEELARLIALESQVRQVREGFERSRQSMSVARDTVLGWQRRVRDAKNSGASDADATYDALRRALRASRDELSSALKTLNGDGSEVPPLGPDPLLDIPSDIATEATRERRTSVERAIFEARRDEDSLREERAAALLDEIDSLNRERLGLLPSLSRGKRDAITGFTLAGWDQARSEARHLMLILRYHQHVALTWIGALRKGAQGTVSPWRTTAVLVPLVLVVLAFVWGRRRTQPLLELVESRLAATDRTSGRTSPSVPRRIVRVVLKIRRQLEWIALFLAVFWVLPKGARGLIEVQLVASAVGWMLAGSLIINTINAVAAGTSADLIPRDEGERGKLRLRSLRLVGRTVIVFTLILGLSTRLVGEGTIYSWVFSTCWFAAIPIFLLLVRWWRETAFERLDRLRKKTPLQTWILANRSGWKSFAAAMIGALQLFTTGTVKLVRSWLSGFEIARRTHAYLFRRELERIGVEHALGKLTTLPAHLLDALHPEHTCERWLPCPNDELRDSLIQRAASRRGGLVVAVGLRGMGKSSLLNSIARQAPGVKVLECTAAIGVPEFQIALEGSPSMILIDDAHTLIESRIGGLTRFDEIIAFARAHSETTAWVFAVDAALWPLLRRARDARPMFDETHLLARWNERQLGALLADRCQAAGLSPCYDDLLDKLPPGTDEIDRQDALNARRAGYERMLWDHVGGNPGLALQAWRVSLALDGAGVVRVRPLQVLDVTKLERLPDSSLFVLRAVLQLAPTTAQAIAQATGLLPEEVLQELRFGTAHGFYEEQLGGVRVAWTWLRAVSRLLERRHLLVNL